MKFSRMSVFALAMACALFASTGSAQTATPATGLGQAWPNAQDVSQNPHYHVYIFKKDGIRYIQVNDLAGGVLGAFAVAGKEILALPIGHTATVTTTASPEVSTASQAPSETVYRDSTATVLLQSCGDPWSCGGGNVVAVPSPN